MTGNGVLPEFDNVMLMTDHAFNDLYDTERKTMKTTWSDEDTQNLDDLCQILSRFRCVVFSGIGDAYFISRPVNENSTKAQTYNDMCDKILEYLEPHCNFVSKGDVRLRGHTWPATDIHYDPDIAKNSQGHV